MLHRFALLALPLRASAAHAAVVALVSGLTGCNQTPPTQATQSLRGTSDISFVCVASDDAEWAGRPIDACPSVGLESNKLIGLALQQETGEVAVVDMTTCREGTGCRVAVPDLERTQPGINFLPVGAEPVSIASTPGGMASFVGVSEPGKEGLFALPTSCIGPRPEDEAYRDLRTWPACRLPVAPGAIQVLVDQQRTTACDGTASPQGQRECPADLSQEFVQPGRRKLAVALPSLGALAVIDAQRVLDAEPGSFEDCSIEQLLALQVELPADAAEQAVPSDMAVSDAACLPKEPAFRTPQTFSSSPSDMALSGERLYVSDHTAPVVHVLDTEDKCALRELSPLLPTSYNEPSSVVTTRRLAVSPETTKGEQFVYAVDGSNTRAAGSLMVFDVSAGAMQRTPLLRPRSTMIWGEPPDRIRFEQEVRDIEFARQDRPVADPTTGVAVEGVMCDPDPSRTGNAGPGALYRPSSDGSGASPVKLRGVFGFAVLQSGIITVIDVEDLDAPCRRPASVNGSDVPDLRGCVNDDFDDELYVGEVPTVSGEFSCNIFEQHRARAGTFYNDGSFGTAPFLRAFPQLRGPDGTSLAVDRTARGRFNPRLLGVNFSPSEGQSGDAEVLVGATRYENDPAAADRLRLDPALAQRNSVVLPFVEPRAYTTNSVNTVTYEGVVRGPAPARFEVVAAAELSGVESSGPLGVFSGGPDAAFCTAGIEDVPAMRLRGQSLMPEAGDATLDQFSLQHADYVQLSADVLDADDRYWDSETGSQCGARYQSSGQRTGGRSACEVFFGTAELPDGHRELRVVRAYSDRLIVEPRHLTTSGERDATLEMIQCCFPGGAEFRVRASEHWVMNSNGRMLHPIETNPETLACQRSCDPLLSDRNGRIFEVSCDGAGCANNAEDAAVIGPSDFGDDQADSSGGAEDPALACVLQSHPEGGIQPGTDAARCIFDGLTARFVIYRGLNPSERGMQFSWTTVGGFRPMAVDLYGVNRINPTAMPEKLVYVPQLNRLVVADGDATGLFVVGLRRDDGGPGFSQPTFAY